MEQQKGLQFADSLVVIDYYLLMDSQKVIERRDRAEHKKGTVRMLFRQLSCGEGCLSLETGGSERARLHVCPVAPQRRRKSSMSSELIFSRRGFLARHVSPVKPDKRYEVSGQSPTKKRRRQLSDFLKMAILAVAILVALCTDARAEQLLSAEDIRREIVGHSFQGRKGIMSVTLHYGRDGTVRMKSPLGTGQGNWTLSDNRFCVKLVTGPRKADECLTLIRLSEGEYRASNGLRLTLKQ